MYSNNNIVKISKLPHLVFSLPPTNPFVFLFVFFFHLEMTSEDNFMIVIKLTHD